MVGQNIARCKTKLNARRKPVDSRRCHVAAKGERLTETLLVNHELRTKI